MRDLGVKGVHIAERDTQRSKPEADERLRQHLVGGRLSFRRHAARGARLGTHEKWLPDNGRLQTNGSRAGAYLLQPGANTRVRSWCPTPGAQFGFLVTHNESISIADFFTLREGDKVVYRPTCHYAYHPSDDAVLSLHELFGRAEEAGPKHILDETEIVDGIDELGVSSTAMRRMPTGTARSSPSRRRATRTASERDRPAGDLRGDRRHGVGARESARPASSRPTRWTIAAASRSSDPISVP